MTIIISARATVSQCNNQAGLCIRVNELETRDFVFTSGHVRRIAEFARRARTRAAVHIYARVRLCAYYGQTHDTAIIRKRSLRRARLIRIAICMWCTGVCVGSLQ